MALTPRSKQASYALCLAVGLTALGSLTGCRVTERDVSRWETTELGPDKLVAVVTHDKYDWPLRIDAAAALIRMKPRGGRRIGIGKLQAAVFALPPEERKKLVAGLVPIIVNEMSKPVGPAQGMAPGEQKGDPTVPWKDAAFALLNYEKGTLVSDDAVRKNLQDALVSWAIADFDRRVAINAQLYSLEQIFRSMGAEGVKALAPKIDPKRPDASYDKMSNLIAELADQPTKELASQRLVQLATYAEGQDFYNTLKANTIEANKIAGYTANEKQLQAQVSNYQDEQIAKVYASLKKVGGRPAVDYLLGVAGDKNKPEKRRELALAALEGRLDRNNPQDIQRVLAIASADDTPDSVRQQAFQRASDLPRDAVAPKLFDVMNAQKDPKKWKIRWVAGSTILKMSAAKDINDFLGKLPPNPAAGFTLAEGTEYGRLLGQMKPAPTKQEIAADLKSPSVATKLVALGYFMSYGTAADLPTVQPLENDNEPTPKVEDTDAKWQCAVPKAGGKPGETELKDAPKVGDFVKLCVEPAMQARK